jgi:BlaI family penicillinase repressor
MASRSRPHPAELELRILKILWREGPLLVRDVRNHLAEGGRDLAHTTIVTTLNTMVGKRFVKRTRKLNAYIFEARVGEEEVSRGMLTEFADRVFGGAVDQLVVRALEAKGIPQDELDKIEKLLDEYKS